jgi:O-antigen ligase
MEQTVSASEFGGLRRSNPMDARRRQAAAARRQARMREYRRWSQAMAAMIVAVLFVAQLEHFAGLVLRLLSPAFVALLVYRFREEFLAPPVEIRWFGAFVVWSLAGLLNAVDLGMYWRVFRLVAQIAILMLAIYVVVRRTRVSRPLLWGFVIAALSYVARSFFTGEFNTIEGAGYPALGGSIGPNGYAFVLLIGITALLLLWRPEMALWRQGAMAMLGTLLAANLVLTASRKAFGALVLMLLFWAVWCVRRRLAHLRLQTVLGVAGGLGLLFMLVTSVQGTFLENRLTRVRDDPELQLKHRRTLYDEGLDMIRSYPVAGVGLGNFLAHSPSEGYAHSDALEVAATTGIVGLLIYGGMYLALIRRLWRLRRRLRDRQALYQLDLVFVFLVCQGLISLGRPNFMDVIFMPFLALTLGIVGNLETQLPRTRWRAATTG